jgi:hypothetical protein
MVMRSIAQLALRRGTSEVPVAACPVRAIEQRCTE